MAEKAEFVLGANFGTPYGSGSQLIFFTFNGYNLPFGTLVTTMIKTDLFWIVQFEKAFNHLKVRN
jgi:hypothetical protein